MSGYKKVPIAVDENKARLLALSKQVAPLTDEQIKEAFGKTLDIATKESLSPGV